jgi:putative transposase
MRQHINANRDAFAESFFKTVKCEEVYVHLNQILEEGQTSLLTILENVYNAKRLLSSLDYVPPDEFELKYAMC